MNLSQKIVTIFVVYDLTKGRTSARTYTYTERKFNLEAIYSVVEETISVLRSITIMDVIDIILLSLIIFEGWKLVRETKANQLLKAVVTLLVVYIISGLIGLKAIEFLLRSVFSIGILALIILFQPEIRRALEKVGRTGLKKLGLVQIGSEPDSMNARWETAIDAICDSCDELSATTTGALIVIERQIRLGEHIDNGTRLDALPSKELFGNIFYPKTPLHDGAAILRDGIIIAAACFLPAPQKEELINKKLGSRHRAAIGMSENSDAIVIVVSEETGTISIAENGELTRGYTRDSLKKYLRSKLIAEKPAYAEKERKRFVRGKKQ